MTPALSLQHIDFSYGGQPPLFRDLSLEIGQGERFGLFGPNGAGKTTLMHLMTGLLPARAGSIQLLGEAVSTRNPRYKRLFGLVPQELSFYDALTPLENLTFFGAWARMNHGQIRQRSHELLQLLGLWEVRHRPVHTFSGGMKRRLNLAIGVLHQPPVLLLDEPTVGVDVQSRNAIMHYLRQLNEKGTTLIYTSHQLQEAEQLCTRVALIDQGRILVCDELTNLLAKEQAEGLEGLFLRLTGQAYRNS
ncbi:MAG: ABC transporter ATP-binding protein [Bacteroidetes bacterium]|nr:MAG: ABC transporter ATP-binding protein [Bacteroidota bacterium]